jgi:tetratricopeptide (TPR) repeat protein
MTKLLFAVAAIALSTNATLATDWSGVDCDTLRSPARGECEQGKVDSTLARKAACYKFKELSDRLHKAGPEELAKVGVEDLAKGDAYLRRCAREFPWPWSVEPEGAPAPSPPTPLTPWDHRTRGLAALNEGEFDAAIAEFTAEIADDPKNPFAYIRRGTAYEKKGNAASAIGDYRMVLTLVDADTGAEYAAKIRKLKKTKK